MSFEAYRTIERLGRLANEYAREARQARADERTAYKRGAEAMREACAETAKRHAAGWFVVERIQATPIPGEP